MENKEITLGDNSQKEEFINNFINEFFQAKGTSVFGCHGDCGEYFDNKNLCGAGCKKIIKLNEDEIKTKKEKLKGLVEELYEGEIKINENINLNFSVDKYLLKEYFKNMIKNILADKRKDRLEKELQS